MEYVFTFSQNNYIGKGERFPGATGSQVDIRAADDRIVLSLSALLAFLWCVPTIPLSASNSYPSGYYKQIKEQPLTSTKCTLITLTLLVYSSELTKE